MDIGLTMISYQMTLVVLDALMITDVSWPVGMADYILSKSINNTCIPIKITNWGQSQLTKETFVSSENLKFGNIEFQLA